MKLLKLLLLAVIISSCGQSKDGALVSADVKRLECRAEMLVDMGNLAWIEDYCNNQYPDGWY